MDIQMKKLAEGFFDIARDSFLRDGYLRPAGFIVTNTNVLVVEIPPLKDGQTKEEVGEGLQQMAAEKNAKALFFLAEAWMRAVDLRHETPEEVKRRIEDVGTIADLPEKQEVISMTIRTAKGETAWLYSVIKRKGKNVDLGKTCWSPAGVTAEGRFTKPWTQ